MLLSYKFYFILFQLEVTFQSISILGRPTSFILLYALYSARIRPLRERDSYIQITIHAVSLGTEEAKVLLLSLNFVNGTRKLITDMRFGDSLPR